MSDEQPTAPRWLVPREPATLGLRLIRYVVLTGALMLAAYLVGMAVAEEACLSSSDAIDCDLSFLGGFAAAFVALCAGLVIMVVTEIWLARKRRRTT